MVIHCTENDVETYCGRMLGPVECGGVDAIHDERRTTCKNCLRVIRKFA